MCGVVWAQSTILVLGDSLSSGYGFQPSLGWVTLLQQRIKEQKLPYRVINASISGDTTHSGLARLPKALADFQPDIVIIELGGNDGLRALPLATIKRNLNEMVSIIQDQEAQPILVGVRLPSNYGPEYTEQFQQIFHEIAAENEIPLVPLALADVDEHATLMQPDGIHPTVEAQPIILDNVWRILEPLLK